jgi:ATP-dependent DNA helicase DinG
VLDALDASRQFFDFIATKLLTPRPVVRIRETGAAEPMLDGPLGALHRLIGKLADKLEDGREHDEMLEQQQRIKGLQAGLTEWLTLGDPGHVYWAERSGRKQTIVTLRSAPIDVAPELRKHLFGCRTSVVCTSATLAMGGSIEPLAARIGADGAEAVAVKSPFDFERNMRVYVAADVPLPSPREARLALDALTDYIRFCTEKVRGGSLVLFTSYTDMRAVALELEPGWRRRPAVPHAGRRPFAHGARPPDADARQRRAVRHRQFLDRRGCARRGALPGHHHPPALRSPHPPHHRGQVRAHPRPGGNPFNDLTLPDALIKFRQGVGRLIRNKTDRGIVTILDSRVLAKSYGREFLGSLPTGGLTSGWTAPAGKVFLGLSLERMLPVV